MDVVGTNWTRITAKAACISWTSSHCKTKALAMAGSPQQAAYMTFGHAVYQVDDMGAEDLHCVV